MSTWAFSVGRAGVNGSLPTARHRRSGRRERHLPRRSTGPERPTEESGHSASASVSWLASTTSGSRPPPRLSCERRKSQRSLPRGRRPARGRWHGVALSPGTTTPTVPRRPGLGQPRRRPSASPRSAPSAPTGPAAPTPTPARRPRTSACPRTSRQAGKHQALHRDAEDQPGPTSSRWRPPRRRARPTASDLAEKKYYDGTTCHRLTTGGPLRAPVRRPDGHRLGRPRLRVRRGEPAPKVGNTRPARWRWPRRPGQQRQPVLPRVRGHQLPPTATPSSAHHRGPRRHEKVAEAGVEGGGEDGKPANR